MITLVLIGSAVTALVLVVLVQGKWTNRDSWFAAVFASAVMAMVIDHYINQIN
jgi:uncharacterized membrane protein YjjP (DUF1212 family)